MRHAIRLAVREIILLAQVIAQVIKLKAGQITGGNAKPADEFPVARADPNAASSSGTLTVREVVKKRMALEFTRSAQHGSVAYSVDQLLLRLQNGNEVEQGRVE